MSTIKNYIWVVLVLGLAAIPSAAQRVPSKSAQGRSASAHAAAVDTSLRTKRVSRSALGLSPSEAAAAIDTSIANTCAETAPTAPRVLAHNPQVFSAQRIASTLNGVWLGKVSGEYDQQLFAPDGFLNVDYYMVVDVNRGEVFVLQAFGSNRAGGALQPIPGAPKWSYVWCARGNYQHPSPRQIHEFTKVSNNVEDARALLTSSTGVNLPGSPVVLSDVWRQLVGMQFFDDPSHSLAYAGVLFKPFTMGNVATGMAATGNVATSVASPAASPAASPNVAIKPAPVGGSLFELRLVGEYRGSGQTAAKFAPGEPIHNVEQGRFLGLSVGLGDFLVASFGLGNAMFGPKNDFDFLNGPQMFFDKVVIGPLSGAGTASPSGTASLSDTSSKRSRK